MKNSIKTILIMLVFSMSLLTVMNVQAKEEGEQIPIYYAETLEDGQIIAQRVFSNRDTEFTIRYLASMEKEFLDGLYITHLQAIYNEYNNIEANDINFITKYIEWFSAPYYKII